MKIRLADGLPVHPTMKHPRTGEPLRALGYRRSGAPVWPVMGASGEEGTTENGGEESENSSGQEGSEETDGGSTDSRSPREKELEEELDRVKRHRSEADKKREAAQNELNTLKNKDLPEIDRLKAELEAEKQSNQTNSTAFKKLAITNAFLTSTQRAKIVWHDPEVARAAAIFSDLEVGEDGKVEGMDKVVKDLAKAKPFLVDNDKPADEKEKQQEKPKNGASGSAVGSGGGNGKGEKGKPTRDDLLARFPALRK